MEDAKILDICPGADPDPVDVPPDDGGEPDAGFSPDDNIADDLGRVGDPCGRIDDRKAVPERKNHDAGLSFDNRKPDKNRLS
jgi:hypothetical protein